MALFGKKTKEQNRAPLQEAAVPAEAVVKTALPQGEDAAGYGAVLHPHQTEKAVRGIEVGQYTFRVRNDANKFEIKRAIEKLYKVKVERITVAYRPSKTRRIGRQIGQRPAFKKSTVTLAAGQKIDLA